MMRQPLDFNDWLQEKAPYIDWHTSFAPLLLRYEKYRNNFYITTFLEECEEVLRPKWREVHARNNKRPTGFEKFSQVPDSFRLRGVRHRDYRTNKVR